MDEKKRKRVKKGQNLGISEYIYISEINGIFF